DDGQAYLYWGNPHLYYIRLNEDMVSYDQGLGVVKVPLTEEAFGLRIAGAKNTFSWAESIDGLASHSIRGGSGKYYWYVSAIDRSTHKKVIGVGVGRRANGPFSDVLGKPLVTEGCDGGNINPTVIYDEAKQPWLTWGSPDLWYAKLGGDMISFDRAAPVPAEKKEWFGRKIGATVNSTEKRCTTYEEGPWLYKRSGLYYLFYPAGGVPEHLAYSTAATAVGPWKYGDTVMEVIGKGGAFTNHPGVADYKGKTYLFYHNGALPGGGGFDRSVCVDELSFRADGSVRRVVPSAGIRDGAGSVNPYEKVEAETIAWESGVETAADSLNGVYVTEIEEGDYIKVRNVDFREGARSFGAWVAAAGPGGEIEIRVDSVGGAKIGICRVKGTGGKWEMVSCKVKRVVGMHDVFFVFAGEGSGLFTFDWWKFKL
ncbi:MAG: family 43 glycosylhydrolase, partial [Bacteroidetes bacterium]|nr:family 43 glycosylhydrolase [Bacteroidota bacterium]